MHILLTNDDGLKAPGLQTLKRELASHDCRLNVVAPNGQRSAASHSMTINKALYCRDESTVPGIREIAVSGTPVDCVKMAMEYFLKEDKPDLIISGINDGYNLGSDVLYSGTVSAAMEGPYYGLPAFAVSMLGMTDERCASGTWSRSSSSKVASRASPTSTCRQKGLSAWTTSASCPRRSRFTTMSSLKNATSTAASAIVSSAIST